MGDGDGLQGSGKDLVSFWCLLARSCHTSRVYGDHDRRMPDRW